MIGNPAALVASPTSQRGRGGGGAQFRSIILGIAEVQVTELFVKEGDMIKESSASAPLEIERTTLHKRSGY